MDTIAAPLTGAGTTAVAIVRVSGPAAAASIEKLAVRGTESLKAPRTLVFSEVELPSGLSDQALVCFFPAPNSFTGEDVAEFHLHGGGFLTGKLMERLGEEGIRLARPGEFSERAFENGRLDLSQAEAISDLITAESEAQARLASSQLKGAVADCVEELGEPLRDLLARVEASIDFPEEEIDPEELGAWGEELFGLHAKLEELIASFAQGRLMREGVSVVLLGPPNAGKSSLLNALSSSERAIVSAEPGTTRDSIEAVLELSGYKVSFWDTAGLEEGGAREVGAVEAEGIRRSWERAQDSDLVICLFELGQGLDQALLRSVQKLARPYLLVGNKSDLSTECAEGFDLQVSAKTGQGLLELKQMMFEKLGLEQGPAQAGIIANARHRQCLVSSMKALEQAKESLSKGAPPELLAADIRAGLSALEDIIGVTHTEDILGRIFSKFCIGK